MKGSYKLRDGNLVSDDAEELIIPNEAIRYVVNNFLQEKAASNKTPVIVGISTADVESVLQLFVNWAAKNGYIKNGILTIGGYKIDQ